MVKQKKRSNRPWGRGYAKIYLNFKENIKLLWRMNLLKLRAVNFNWRWRIMETDMVQRAHPKDFDDRFKNKLVVLQMCSGSLDTLARESSRQWQDSYPLTMSCPHVDEIKIYPHLSLSLRKLMIQYRSTVGTRKSYSSVSHGLANQVRWVQWFFNHPAGMSYLYWLGLSVNWG